MSVFFFFSKCSLFHTSNVFGSYIIHILYTRCAKIKKINSGAKRLNIAHKIMLHSKHRSQVWNTKNNGYATGVHNCRQSAHLGV
jgi:hypothetical protein